MSPDDNSALEISPVFFDSEQEQVYQKRTTKNVDIYQVIGSENV